MKKNKIYHDNYNELTYKYSDIDGDFLVNGITQTIDWDSDIIELRQVRQLSIFDQGLSGHGVLINFNYSYPLVKSDDPILRRNLIKELNGRDKFTSEYGFKLRKIVDRMFETLSQTKTGIGLAAPQVGLDIPLFVINVRGVKQEFIYPRIENRFGPEEEYLEGCLSIPGTSVPVVRHSKISISYYDKDENRRVDDFDGLVARVIQHEYDHLQGILITDYLYPPQLINIMQEKIVHKEYYPSIVIEYPLCFIGGNAFVSFGGEIGNNYHPVKYEGYVVHGSYKEIIDNKFNRITQMRRNFDHGLKLEFYYAG